MKLERLICWCLIVVVPLSAWPQSQPGRPAGVEDHKEKLSKGDEASKVQSQVRERGTGERATLKITLRDRTEVKGYISQINADSFQVTDKKNRKGIDGYLRSRRSGQRRRFVPGCQDRNLGRGGRCCGYRVGLNGSHAKPLMRPAFTRAAESSR